MASLLTELQFCQLENDALRERLKTIKMDMHSLQKQIVSYIKDLQNSSGSEDGSITITKEQAEKLFIIIDKAIK